MSPDNLFTKRLLDQIENFDPELAEQLCDEILQSEVDGSYTITTLEAALWRSLEAKRVA